MAVTLAEIMASSGHDSIHSTSVAPTSRQRAEGDDSSTRSWPLAGRFKSKLLCLDDALGRPYDALIDPPGRAPAALPADKGYDADAIRADLADWQSTGHHPGRSNRRMKVEHDPALSGSGTA